MLKAVPGLACLPAEHLMGTPESACLPALYLLPANRTVRGALGWVARGITMLVQHVQQQQQLSPV